MTMHTAKQIQNVLEYVGESLRWKDRPREHFKAECAYENFRRNMVGTEAGTVLASGKRVVCLDRVRYRSEYLVWTITRGELPNGKIYHIDGDLGNDSPENLTDQPPVAPMSDVSELTLAYAHEAVEYDPSSGVFTWKARPRSHFRTGERHKIVNTKHAGHAAGSLNNKYLEISLCGVRVKAHRLAWFMTYGRWPKYVDHIDRNPLNNRLANLRECDLSGNAANSKLRSTNTSGVRGVQQYGSKWVAAIKKNRKSTVLGAFDTIFDAAKAYRIAYVECFGEFADTTPEVLGSPEPRTPTS